jgi:hypothetical protein
MARLLRVAIFMACVFSAGSAFATAAPGGTCPASAPVTGKNCYFIAANGSDTNNGTSETTPWLHAPGMQKCASNCAAVLSYTSGGIRGSAAGLGFIFRGGDTWHFGNSGLSPYTGGTWNWIWQGSSSTCTFEGAQTGCAYLGVDTTWYNSSNCSAWCRPILNGDNPTSTSTVASCAYQIANASTPGPSLINTMVALSANENNYIYFDNFELTGLCGATSLGGNQGSDNDYIGIKNDGGSSASQIDLITNVYIHGWTTTSLVNTDETVCNAISGDASTALSFANLVVDGTDSNPAGCPWAGYPSFFHFKDSIIRHTTQGISQNCHDIHDVIFEYLVPPAMGGHQNILECNADASVSTANVVYNNIVRHSNMNVDLWFCPNTTPEYHFNNIMYDTSGEGYSFAGTVQYSGCTWTGGIFFFNNTLSAGGADTGGKAGTWTAPCGIQGSTSSGQIANLNVYNNHLVDTAWSTSTPECTGGPSSATNVSMTYSQGVTQGYLSSSGGTYKTETCANDTTPCSPTAGGNSTVGSGTNEQAYCTTLVGYSGEIAIGTTAANACKYATTDGCAYNTMNHTMVCPSAAWPAVIRPASAVWNSGAYEFPGVSPATNLNGSVSAN